MIVHYFYKRKHSGHFFSLELEAIMEEDAYSREMGKKEKSFTYLEKINCMISKDMNTYHNSTFKIDFGKNSCHGDGERSVNDLYQKKLSEDGYSGGFINITRKQYERLRKLTFLVSEKCKCMDFDLVKNDQTYSITIL